MEIKVIKKYSMQIGMLLCVALLCVTFTGCGKKNTIKDEKTELLVMAAASMTDVLQELATEYKKDHDDIALNFTFASSGALQSQIEEGAPADLFISAAQKQMDALKEKEMVVVDTRKTLLENKVVLIVPAESKNDIQGFEDLGDERIEKIGLGEPTSVPVGQYSEEILNSLDMMNSVNEKVVYGSDVRTVLSWVETGEVDCGVVYKTDAATSSKVNIICEAPEGTHTPVTYPAAVIKTSKHQEAAKEFLDFLSSKTATKIFESYGFSMK